MNLKGRVVIITGGSRGIGFAIAEEFAKNGVNLLLVARDRSRLELACNISSGAGKTGIPELSVYSASKAAVNMFTEALARELSRYNIKVYAVCPGGTDTDLHRKLFPEHRPEWLLKPEEVAKLVLRLVKYGGVEGHCYDIYRLV